MTNKIKLASAAICLGASIGNASASITTHGSSTAYTETGGDWQTMGINDIDASGGLGTDGYIFFDNATSNATYVTSIAAATGTTLAGKNDAYAAIDDPTLTDGTDIATGFIHESTGTAGNDNDLVNFTISGLAVGQTVRVGVLGGIQSATNGRWDSTSFTLTDGTSSATVGDHSTSALDINPGGTNSGWAFFDLDSDGDYTVSGTQRLNSQGSSLGGLTFDSVTVPEPSSTALLGLGGLALILRRRK